jgi:diguanylate cyclase (GGDEF)-like protein
MKIVHPEDREFVKTEFNMENTIKKIKESGVFQNEFRISINGKIKWIKSKSLPIYDENGEIDKIVGIEQDVTEQKKLQIKLEKALSKAEKLAMYDYLTNIYNRRAFFKRTKEEIARIKRHGETLSIILTDIDKFKNINDTYGHDVGDKVLKHFAKVLKSGIRQYDVVARLGGEEFIILLSNANIEEAFKRAEHIRKQIEESKVFIKDINKNVKYTASFGVATLKEEDNYKIEKVIKRADEALYSSKKCGRNRISFIEDNDKIKVI